MSWVKVYGRLGRRSSVACRTWVVGQVQGERDVRRARRALGEGISGDAIATSYVGQVGVLVAWD